MKKYAFLLLFVSSAGSTTLTYAASNQAEIRFKGELKYNPCVVKTEKVVVDFGTLTNSSFDSYGYTEWKRFDLVFEQCPTGLNKVDATFSGSPSDDEPLFGYINAGSAKNISIQLDKQGSELGLGNGRSYSVPIQDEAATMGLAARIKQKENQFFKPGSIDAIVQVALTYQ